MPAKILHTLNDPGLVGRLQKDERALSLPQSQTYLASSTGDGLLWTIQPGDLHPGSGTLTELFDDPGVVLSVRNLLELMLLISDNSATDVVLRVAGGPEVKMKVRSRRTRSG